MLANSTLFQWVSLEGRGLVIAAATDGQQAEDEFQSSPFDLILTDVRMPWTDGN